MKITEKKDFKLNKKPENLHKHVLSEVYVKPVPTRRVRWIHLTAAASPRASITQFLNVLSAAPWEQLRQASRRPETHPHSAQGQGVTHVCSVTTH